ncbi:MAG: helix-turn-helix domain-containing protein [Acidimicrobiales bacterium]|nr:helix-turn-helix domain-containing protein [Acidimicrobiales bacterium]
MVGFVPGRPCGAALLGPVFRIVENARSFCAKTLPQTAALHGGADIVLTRWHDDGVRDRAAIPTRSLDTGRSTAKRQRPPKRASRDVAIVVYDGFAPFELGVACEIFGDDGWVTPGDPWYRLFICGNNSAPVTASGGFQILVPHGLDILPSMDTVIVSPTYRPEEVSETVFEALRLAHAGGCRIVSLCSGAFVLAEAGLLDGHRAATHWTECDELARRYPLVSVDSGVLYVDEGDILTSAGSAAGIDLCLHVVRQDYGSEVATQLARQLVVPPQRDGGQAQFIEHPLPVLDSSNLFADTITWLQEHLDEPVSVEDLAARSAMSPRTFARRFLAATGTTPYQWLLRQRVQLAQRLLEVSHLSIEAVAEQSGFCTSGNLRKHFSRIVNTSPQAYRHAFQDRHTA